MARNGNPNIIPFDDAKRMATSRSSRRADYRLTGSSDDRAFDAGDSYGRGDARANARGSSRDESYDRSTEGLVRSASRGTRGIPLAGVSRSAAATSRLYPAPAARASSGSSLRDDGESKGGVSRPASDKYGHGGGSYSSRLSKGDERRHAKGGRKTDKRSSRRLGGSSDFDSDRSSSSAAAYATKAIRGDRRAYESQRRTPGGARASSSRGRSFRMPDLSRVPKPFASPLGVVLVGLLCLMVALAFLYPTARQYYTEIREHDRLQAEYEAISERNQAMEGRIDHLKTDEGVEDAARKELGWVQEGEVAGTVQGLDDRPSATGGNVDAQVKSGSIPAPETWYSPVLDVVFGYVDPASVVPENMDMSNVDDVAAE